MLLFQLVLVKFVAETFRRGLTRRIIFLLLLLHLVWPAASSMANPTNESVVINAFYPLGERGLFLQGQPIQLALTGTNGGKASVEYELEIKVKDFYDSPADQKVEKLKLAPLSEFRQIVELSPPRKFGFFCVNATLKKEGTQIACLPTGFCVLREPLPERDPFFGMDGQTDDLLKAFKMIGVGSLTISLSLDVPESELGNLDGFVRKQLDNRWKAVWTSDFNLVGYIKISQGYTKRFKDEIDARRDKRLYPYPDALFKELGDVVEAQALVMKPRVRTWVIQEEIDRLVYHRDDYTTGGASELTRHILMTKISYERLKKIDPTFKVAALSLCVDYLTNPPFQMVKKWLLPEIRDYFDMFGLDPYCGEYSFCGGVPVTPESVKFRDVLLNTQKLQMEAGKTNDLLIAEKGLAIPYHLPPDHPVQASFAFLTARNLILAKSVPKVVFYSHFMGVYYGLGWRVKAQGVKSDDENPIEDFGLWKHTVDARGVDCYHPRPAVVAYATVAGMLANARDPMDLTIRSGFFCYLFKKGDKTIAVIWTTSKTPYSIRMPLTFPAECCDLMGNTQKMPVGDVSLLISESPFFLICDVDYGTLSNAVWKSVFPF